MPLVVDISVDRKGVQRVVLRDAGKWEEGKHPRGQPENAGEFAARGTSTAGHLPAKQAEGKRTTAKGQELPAHIKALRIPPAWTAVTYNPDPNGALLATGRDSKGRLQSIYSQSHSAKQAALKFARIKELDRKFDSIKAQNAKARQSKDPAIAATADCCALIMQTGIRPGSDSDTKAAKKAYGATTLLGQHVQKSEQGLVLSFTGKKGVALTIPVNDKDLQDMLWRRKQAAGDDGKLFDTSPGKLLDLVHSFDGGGFKSKDFRTLVGTREAMQEVKQLPAPKGAKDYRKAVMQVAKKVAARLGNTPTIALQSYINPVVFSGWRLGSGTADAAPERDELPDLFLGHAEASANELDWRNEGPPADDPDDEELPQTPPDVVDVLGFDPLDEPATEDEACCEQCAGNE